MTMQWTRTMGLAVALAALAVAWGAPAAAQDPGATEVTVTGEGGTRQQARDDALRRAVEKGAGVVITSRTETVDHAVAFDQIVAKSEGYVQSFTEGEVTQDASGIWRFTLTAIVAVGRIKDDWGQIQLILERKGQPTVMVLVREVVQGRAGTTLEGSSSYAATAIERLLMDKGFRVKSSAGLQEAERRERDAAVAGKDDAKLAAIAKTYGADIVIGGDLLCRFDRQTALPGDMTGYRYVSAAQLKAYRADTADMIASVDVDGIGAAPGEGEAQQKAMQQAARKVKIEVLKEILNHWYFEFQQGAVVELEVTLAGQDEAALRKADRYIRKLKSALEGIKGVKSVIDSGYAKPLQRLAVKSELSTDDLQGAISDLETEGWTLEFTGRRKSQLSYTLHIE